MLRKYTYLATLLLICFLSDLMTLSQAKWEKVMVQEILHLDTYLMADRKRIQMPLINIQRDTNPSNYCYQHKLEEFLKMTLLEETLKIQFQEHYQPTDLYRFAKIKIEGNVDLAEVLLAQGWAQIIPTTQKVDKTYKKAQKIAQKNRLGQWGACDNWYNLRERQRLKGKTDYLKESSKTYLDTISYGWVTNIVAPHIYELENGQKIELQGVTTPAKESEIYACWHKTLQPELENLLLGKKVRLESDQLHLTAQGRKLKRYVWLEGNRWQSPLLINKWMLANNFVQLKRHELNLKHVDLMNTDVMNEAIPSWWTRCALELVSEDEVISKESEAPALKYDDVCPIKGNIAGSKKNPKKTYHTPLSGWYKRIKAEQCFEDETEAGNAGFTKVK